MEAFEIEDLIQQRADSGRPYYEFLRVESMSMGIYSLPVGGVDEQSPHSEDEVYYVVNGRGSVTVDGERRAIMQGSTIFVAAQAEHRFHDIEESLELLVFFAPPET